MFTVQLKQPQSIAGRCWNAAQDVLSLGALALIVLKLTGVITWPWWWVLSPLWASGTLLVVALGVVLVLLILAAISGDVEIAETPDSADRTLPWVKKVLPRRLRSSDAGARPAVWVGLLSDYLWCSPLWCWMTVRCRSALASRAISVPLTPVIKGASRSLADVLRRWSGHVRRRTGQIPKLTVRVRFPSSAPCENAQL